MLHAAELALALALAGPVPGWDAPRDATAPEFTLEDLEGRALRSRDLGGKVVLLDFWATWCGPCIRELPDLAELHRRLAGRADVAFLSLNVTDERETLVEFVSAKRLPYPVYRGDALLGPFSVSEFPTKLVLDLRGDRPRVRLRRRGYTGLESLQTAIDRVLKTP